MRWTDPGRFRAALLVLAGVTTVVAALGIGVRGSFGGQVTGDEPQYLLTALSLGTDGDLDISDELAQERWRSFHEASLPQQTRPLGGGRHISPHDPLLPLLLAAPTALGGWVAAKLTLAVVAGALAALTAWTAVRRFAVSSGLALAVVGVFSVTAPLAVYGSQVYPELPAAVAVMAAAAALTGPLRSRAVLVTAACIIALPWLAVKYVPVAATLALVALVRLWRGGRQPAAAMLLTALGCAGVAYSLVHLAVWGGWTPYASGDHFVGGELTAVGPAPDYLGRTRRLLGLLVDREFGLAAWQPAWLLLPPAVAAVVSRRTEHWLVLVAPLAVAWGVATWAALTMHGFWFPGRQVVVVLPLAVVAIALLCDRLRPARLALAILGGLGALSMAWLLVEGWQRRLTWVVDFTAVGDPWYRAWSTLLPAYRLMIDGTWLRHGLWLAVLIAAAAAASGVGRGAARRVAGRVAGRRA